MRQAHLMVAALLLTGCADSAVPLPTPTTQSKAVAQPSALQNITFYLPGMNKELKIL